ncbi:histidinol-phosphate transaminase [Aliiroseovarius sp. 2305UL8-7]|uniref:histidinol-phosphate transaminase n=1 Tax=Aliiroseovarius conchicola TaxID=3121637 RepID=UPI003527200D
MSIAAKETLSKVAPYKQGQSTIEGVDQVIKLSSNELPFPPSPKAVEAFHATEVDLGRYPDGSQAGLRAAVATVHNLPEANIFAGNGSEEALGLIIRTILSAGDEIVISENSFMMAEIYARSVGAEVVKCAETDFRVDVKAMAAAVTDKTKMVYICTPNNPTGTYTTAAELEWLEAQLPEDMLLLVDAAYAEFVDADDYESGLSMFSTEGRVAVTRTFSKAYGLAAQRIGWAVAPDRVVDAVARLRTPFNTNAAALAAAEAAVLDQDYLAATVARMNTIRRQFVADLEALDLHVVPSQTNFVLIVFGDGGDEAKTIDAALQKAGILGRPVSGEANEFRISIGTEEEMSKTIAVIRDWAQSRAKSNT